MATRYSMVGTVPKGMAIKPSSPRGGGIGQPRYTRGTAVDRKSPRVIALNSCIATALAGKKPGSREAVRTAFAAAAHGCRGK